MCVREKEFESSEVVVFERGYVTDSNVTLQEQEPEVVDHFKYLGSSIEKEEDMSKETKERVMT